jgi:hypothetical protein
MEAALVADKCSPGATVVVLDDVRTTGATLKAAAEAITAAGGIPIAVALTQTYRRQFAAQRRGLAGQLIADRTGMPEHDVQLAHDGDHVGDAAEPPDSIPVIQPEFRDPRPMSREPQPAVRPPPHVRKTTTPPAKPQPADYYAELSDKQRKQAKRLAEEINARQAARREELAKQKDKDQSDAANKLGPEQELSVATDPWDIVEPVPGLEIPIPQPPPGQDICSIASWQRHPLPNGHPILVVTLKPDAGGPTEWTLRWGMPNGPEGIVWYSAYHASREERLILYAWPANQNDPESMPACEVGIELDRDRGLIEEILASPQPSELIIFTADGFDPFAYGPEPAIGYGSPAHLYSIQPGHLRDRIKEYPRWFQDTQD